MRLLPSTSHEAIGLLPNEARESAVLILQDPAVSTRRPHTLNKRLNDILFDVHSLHTLKRDVDFFTNKNPFVHMEFSVFHIERETPEMYQGAQNGNHTDTQGCPNQVSRFVILLNPRGEQNRPQRPNQRLTLPSDQYDNAHAMLSAGLLELNGIVQACSMFSRHLRMLRPSPC